MKKLSDIHPVQISQDPDEWFTSFLRSLLIRTNFMVNVRHRIGWRGLKPTFRNGEGWTCRINGAKGVYGICFDHSTINDGWHSGFFKLYYFPANDEELVEQFSLEAAMICQQADYLKYVREFLCYPEFASLFEISKIKLLVSAEGEALICSVLAQQYLNTNSLLGVCAEISGNTCTLIEPGGLDQNLPAFDISRPFFDVLAATLNYNLDESPAFIKHTSHINAVSPGHEVGHEVLELSLGFNQEWFAKNSISKNLHPNCKVQYFWTHTSEELRPFSEAPFWKAHQQQSARFEKTHFDADGRPQFILLSGFLGSGKTTFLKHLIEYHTSNNRFVAVIQNEIGETGLDAKLLEDNYAVLEIDEGCVCCSLIGQLKIGILEILSNHHPDVIVLETSGLANPLNLLAEIEEIREVIRFESVSTVVDMKNLAAAARCSSVIFDQIKSADILLLSKVDLISNEKFTVLKKDLREMNPKAMMVECTNGKANPALLYTNDPNPTNLSGNLNSMTSGACTHDEAGLGSLKITFENPIDKDIFLKKTSTLPSSVYRMKGVLYFTNSSEACFFQYVNGAYELVPACGEDINEHFLILIGERASLNFFNQIYFTN